MRWFVFGVLCYWQAPPCLTDIFRDTVREWHQITPFESCPVGNVSNINKLATLHPWHPNLIEELLAIIWLIKEMYLLLIWTKGARQRHGVALRFSTVVLNRYPLGRPRRSKGLMSTPFSGCIQEDSQFNSLNQQRSKKWKLLSNKGGTISKRIPKKSTK